MIAALSISVLNRALPDADQSRRCVSLPVGFAFGSAGADAGRNFTRSKSMNVRLIVRASNAAKSLFASSSSLARSALADLARQSANETAPTSTAASLPGKLR